MTIPFPDGGSSDQLSVSPQTLRAATPTYYQEAQEVSSLQRTLVSTVQLAAGDMFLLLEFAQLASKLEQLHERINAAMQCAYVGLNRLGVALSIASDEYPDTDKEVSQTFTRIEDDPNPWNPLIPQWSINTLIKPVPTPTPQLIPGLQNPITSPGITQPEPIIPPIVDP